MSDKLPLTRNRVLALAQDAVPFLERVATRLHFDVGAFVFTMEAHSSVFFPLTGVISLVKTLSSGASVEVAMVGPEGVAGLHGVFGDGQAQVDGITQADGEIAAVEPQHVREAIRQFPSLRSAIERFLYASLGMTAQLALCNRVHRVDERLAHWLLILHDRRGTDELWITHEFLGRMLATRRAGISDAIQSLEESGAIEHRRTLVRIRDRVKLEARSCECYKAMVSDYEKTMGFRPMVTN